jgi:RNA polymerase sigma-70 factor (ECF subfamily)
MTDEQIVQECVSNNSLAQEYLYKKYHRDMFRVCLRYVNYNFKEAEDVVQNGFISVFENIESFKGTGSLKGWIKKIMVNAALSHIRKNKNRKQNVNMDSVEFMLSSNMHTNDSFAVKDLLKIIQTLPVGFKTVFNLYAIEGYSHKEIGEMLNISEGTSKSQYSRAKAHLKRMVVESGLSY